MLSVAAKFNDNEEFCSNREVLNVAGHPKSMRRMA